MPTPLNHLMLLGGIVLLIGIISSKFSARLGMPVMVLFLGLGMLVGSSGIGGVAFEDYALANAIASAALALILFDGGLRTSWSSVRTAWKPAVTLSTLGVFVTSLVTGLAASWLLGIPILVGLLLGAIVGSTDAAAVFAVLRSSGIKLPDRLACTLEIESGSNDPMAIFLTIGLIAVLTEGASSPSDFVLLFATQFGVGALSGVAIGAVAGWSINRVRLDYPGLYPILVTAFGILSFGLAAILGGSGFLAVYVAGVVLGNQNIVFQRGIFLFHDATAWLSQMVLFVMLGLLSFPERLPGVAVEGLLIAGVLTFVARPLAVWLLSWPFRFEKRELVFVSWVGLKGAVPITLATFPLMAGIEGGQILFDIVFFVVLVSALTQGWSMAALARRLGLGTPVEIEPPLTLEINALRHVDARIVEYTVAPSARVAGQSLSNVALPDGVVVALIVRNDEVIVPRGSASLRPKDHVFVAARAKLVPLINRLFDPTAGVDPLPHSVQLQFKGSYTVGQLHRFFGIPGPTWSELKLIDVVTGTKHDDPVRLGPFELWPAEDPKFVELHYDPTQDPGHGNLPADHAERLQPSPEQSANDLP